MRCRGRWSITASFSGWCTMAKQWHYRLEDLVFLGARVMSSRPMRAAEDLAKVPLPEELVAKETSAAPAAVVCFLEGPAVDADGNVFFSDIAGNRILKMNPKGVISVFRVDSGRTNGNCFDAQGRL